MPQGDGLYRTCLHHPSIHRPWLLHQQRVGKPAVPFVPRATAQTRIPVVDGHARHGSPRTYARSMLNTDNNNNNNNHLPPPSPSNRDSCCATRAGLGMDGWMDGWTDGRTDGWMDGWMDGVRRHGTCIDIDNDNGKAHSINARQSRLSVERFGDNDATPRRNKVGVCVGTRMLTMAAQACARTRACTTDRHEIHTKKCHCSHTTQHSFTCLRQAAARAKQCTGGMVSCHGKRGSARRTTGPGATDQSGGQPHTWWWMHTRAAGNVHTHTRAHTHARGRGHGRAK